MVAIATCRYCEAGVAHETCVESVVSATSTDAPAHVHSYQLEMVLDDPMQCVRDCACGHRIHVLRDLSGKETILEDGIVEGGAVDNAVFLYRPGLGRSGVNWFDRWNSL